MQNNSLSNFFMQANLKLFCLNFLIIGSGFVALYWGIWGDLEKLLNPLFRPGLVCAGILLIWMGIIQTDYSALQGCAHLQSLSFLDIGIGITAITLLLFCPAEGLTLKTILNRDSNLNTSILTEQKPMIDDLQFKTDPHEIIDLDLMDLFYIATKEDLRLKIKGRTISLIGQVLHKKGCSLMRILVWCCASDARPLMVEIRGMTQKSFDEGDWREIQGTVTFEKKEESMIPVIHYQESKPIPAPEEIYLY